MRNNNFKRSVISTINYLIRKAKLIKLFLFNLANFLKENKFIIIDFIATCIIFFLFKKIGLFNFTSTSTAVSVFTTIASILASIVGIVIAILLVAFELQYKTFGVFVYRKFFKDSTFIFLFRAFISTIFISIIAAINVEKYFKDLDSFLFNFPLFLFIFCLLILYPSFKKILSSTEPKSKIKESIKVLLENLKNLDKSNIWDSNQKIENLVSELQEVFSIALKDNDKETIKFILSELAKKTPECLLNKQSRTISDNFKHILGLLKYYTEESFRQKDEFVLIEILKYLRDLKEFGQYTPEFPVLELDFFLRDILWKATKEDFTSVCEKGFDILEANLEEDLKNHALFKRNGVDKSESENINYHREIYIETTYLSTLNYIIERSIDLERIDIIRRGFFSIQKISLPVARDENLDDYVRQKVVEKSYLITRSLTLKCVDKGIYRMVSETIFSSFALIWQAFKKDAYYASLYDRALQYYLVTLIEIAKEDFIDINYRNQGLSIIWSIADECLYHFNNQFFLDTLNLIIIAFDDIKKVIESKKNNLDNEKTYSLIRLHLETILNTMGQKNLHNGKIEEKILLLLKDFKEKEK